MTLYLTDDTPASEIARARASGFVHACKYYPAGATTNSAAGVTNIDNAWPMFAAMEREGMVLCVHGEVTDADIDVFDRERVFIERHLARIVAGFPALRIVFEHATTREAIEFVRAAGPNVAATLTPQHLLYSRNARWAPIASCRSLPATRWLGARSFPPDGVRGEVPCSASEASQTAAVPEVGIEESPGSIEQDAG